ncbi:MAG: NAD-dependent epimerase/dehydratase family protein [Lachnospiraceae bacterium]|nr:NAD-dependent epimerase/dehydratase family protein [Lachnospiraceae bacterium]
MNILIIGGSYFLGPAIIKEALKEGYGVTVFNRGTRSPGLPGVAEIRGDRTCDEDLMKITGSYDAVIDTCAYVKGDIRKVRDVLEDRCGRYVFISTVDVLERGTGLLLDESAKLETRDFGGDAGAYILGKAALEREIADAGDHCILRPSVIYGPGNYAPRENIYFKWISAAGQILEPSPSDGTFQAVYVGDVARAALRACADEGFSRRTFNVTPSEPITYERFTQILKVSTGTDFEVIKITPEEALAGGVPFPFPLSAAESEKYDGSALEKTGFDYTDICTGMKEAWEYYVHSR